MAGRQEKDLKRAIGLFFKPGLNLPNCLTLCGALIILMAVFKPNSSELASWVQAIGSIAAIYGAFSISQKQADLDRKNRQADDRAKAISFKRLISSGPKVSRRIARVSARYPLATANLRTFQEFWTTRYKHELEVALQALNSIPAHELASWGLINNFNSIKSGLEIMRQQAELLNGVSDSSSLASNSQLFAKLHIADAHVQNAWKAYQGIHRIHFREVDDHKS